MKLDSMEKRLKNMLMRMNPDKYQGLEYEASLVDDTDEFMKLFNKELKLAFKGRMTKANKWEERFEKANIHKFGNMCGISDAKAFIKQEIKRVVGEDEPLRLPIKGDKYHIEANRDRNIKANIRNELKAQQRRKAEIK